MVELQYWLVDLQVKGGASLLPGGLALLLGFGLAVVVIRRLLGGLHRRPVGDAAALVMVVPPSRRGPGLVEVFVAVISLIAALLRLSTY